jgi:hypothetical protein
VGLDYAQGQTRSESSEEENAKATKGQQIPCPAVRDAEGRLNQEVAWRDATGREERIKQRPVQANQRLALLWRRLQ